MNGYQGYPKTGVPSDEDLGIIARVTLREGQNTFKVTGLGPFTKVEQLAGRGASVSKGHFYTVSTRKSRDERLKSRQRVKALAET